MSVHDRDPGENAILLTLAGLAGLVVMQDVLMWVLVTRGAVYRPSGAVVMSVALMAVATFGSRR